jgi:translation initiation factor 1
MPRKPPDPPPPGPFNPAFAGLAGKLGLPASPAPPAARPPAAKPPPARAVVRFEKKGRGGKAVTVIEKLSLGPAELEAWLSELKRALGCGGTVEEGALVLQGDSRERVGRLLEARGVKKVTVA